MGNIPVGTRGLPLRRGGDPLASRLRQREQSPAETISQFLLTFTPTNPVYMSNTFNRPIRVLVAKVGLDGHDRGARIIATSLRDAGMEVIYTGLRQTPEMVVNTALQEDVDAIGISILSGAHMTVFPKILQLIKEKKMDDVLITGGGIIPESDMRELKKIGVGELFPPGTNTKDIVQYITDWVKEHRNF